MPYVQLNRIRLTAALRRLAELATEEKIVLELSLYGGAVFTLVYGSRESTRDVDGLIRPESEGKRLARRVAQEQDLPSDWLSGDVTQFLADREEKRRVLEGKFGNGLRVTAPTAAYLLALKLRASRPRLPGYIGDEADIEFADDEPQRARPGPPFVAAEILRDHGVGHDRHPRHRPPELQQAARHVVGRGDEAQARHALARRPVARLGGVALGGPRLVAERDAAFQRPGGLALRAQQFLHVDAAIDPRDEELSRPPLAQQVEPGGQPRQIGRAHV